MYFDPLPFCVYLHMDRKELSSETLKEVFEGLEHLLGKHEDLTLIFSSHIKSWNSVQACNPSTEYGNYGGGGAAETGRYQELTGQLAQNREPSVR